MEEVHFRLTCVAQKRRCLSSLMDGLRDGLLLPSQWRAQGGAPIIFRLSWKKIFGDRPSPPYLRVWMTGPPPLISRSEFGTASCGWTKDRFGFISGFMWMGPQWSNLHLNWFIRKSRTSSAITWTSGLTQILRRSSPSYGDVLLHTVDDKIPLYFCVGVELRFLECSKRTNESFYWYVSSDHLHRRIARSELLCLPTFRSPITFHMSTTLPFFFPPIAALASCSHTARSSSWVLPKQKGYI